MKKENNHSKAKYIIKSDSEKYCEGKMKRT